MDCKLVISLLFPTFYKIREQPKHKKNPFKNFKRDSTTSFFIVFGMKLDKSLNFLLTSVYKSTASWHWLTLGNLQQEGIQKRTLQILIISLKSALLFKDDSFLSCKILTEQ